MWTTLLLYRYVNFKLRNLKIDVGFATKTGVYQNHFLKPFFRCPCKDLGSYSSRLAMSKMQVVSDMSSN